MVHDGGVAPRVSAPLLVIVAALAMIPASSGGATSPDDESLPRIVLLAGGEGQRGRLWSSTGADGDGNQCVAGHGDGFPNPPRRGLELGRDPFRGRFVIDRNEEPRVRVDGYTELDEYGYISFDSSHRVKWRVHPRPSAASPVRWVVTFRTPSREHVYLDLTASWRDPSGCGRDEGSYVFHIARR